LFLSLIDKKQGTLIAEALLPINVPLLLSAMSIQECNSHPKIAKNYATALFYLASFLLLTKLVRLCK
jgi:ABC-type transport system involved in cytochrome c biogenesis permease component